MSASHSRTLPAKISHPVLRSFLYLLFIVALGYTLTQQSVNRIKACHWGRIELLFDGCGTGAKTFCHRMKAVCMNGQRVGYVRVSSVDQNAERQLVDIKLDKIFTDRASGRDANRPALSELLACPPSALTGQIDLIA
jgi:hypothetical protein